MQKIYFIIVFLAGLISINAQKKVNLEEKLQGLHIAMEDEMSGKTIEPDKRVKMYLDDGTVIKRKNAEKYFNPEFYDKLIYLNEEGDIKAYVFTKIEDFNIGTNDNPVDISPKQKAIYFNLTDINGNKYRLDELKGKIIVMNYWFSACRPCVMEMPELNKLVDKYRDKNVVFLGLTYHIKPNIERFLQRFEFKYNLIPESQIEIHNYHVQTYPTHIIIDQNGYIVLREEGLSYDTVDLLDKTIEALLKR
jgi:peroxiredoxin